MKQPRRSHAQCGTTVLDAIWRLILPLLPVGLLGVGLLLLSGTTPQSSAATPRFLQWFETRWSTIEYRMPDFFVAGYDSTWLPPPWRASDPTSAGYDCFDRFDLGRPGNPTAFGTEDEFRAMVSEFHQADSLVYVDLIMNHNSVRNGNPTFVAEGNYPGFAMGLPGNFWGDFHPPGFQSENPNAPNYNLWEGDLVGLIDINQFSQNFFIRHPVEPNPQNIPQGTIRDRIDPENRRFYPDLSLPPMTFQNSARPIGQQTVTVYPFNTENPMAGDPVVENASDLLLRSTQYMLDVMKIDGFRLDAAKHIPQVWWNQEWDNAVFNRRVTPTGNRVTPFSFGEIVDSNAFTRTYTRKDGFGNRDALDLNGAGQLRNVLNANGLGSWQNVIDAHLDNEDDGFNNGSLGVNHIFSHDNGSTGDGGSIPPYPGSDRWFLPGHAYILFRPGPALVYHHSREFIDLYAGSRGFWPREGNPTALGTDNASINLDLVRLVQLSRGYARGEFNFLNGTDPQNQSLADVLVFERRRNQGSGSFSANVLVAVNDRMDGGFETRFVQTSFPPGTRLHELTGNAANPVVNPSGQISQVLVVDSNRRVTIRVPNNRNSSGVLHHKGYVIYGPAAPSGTLEIVGATGVLPADDASVPSYRRRINEIDIVTGDTFIIRLVTDKTDPLDPAWDDNALFKINQGAEDFNGNGSPDIPEDCNCVVPLYEQFVTTRLPLASTPGASNGIYEQVIDAAQLGEGYHYISVVAFRQRPGNTDPIYHEWRRVIYIDRTGPDVSVLTQGELADAQQTFRVRALDRTADSVHLIINPNPGPLIDQVDENNRLPRHDRFEWRQSLASLPAGTYEIGIVAIEITGNHSEQRLEISINRGTGDVDRDGVVTIDDLYAAYALTEYDPAADMNGDGVINATDFRLIEALLRNLEVQKSAGDQR